MFNKVKNSVLIVLSLSLMIPFTAFAGVIDDFQAGEYNLGREGTPMPYTVTYTENSTFDHIIGGQRDVSFYKTSGSTTQPYLNQNPTGWGGITGISSYNSAFSCSGQWTQTYGATQDLNADLSQDNGTALLLEIVGGDMGGPNPRPVPFTFTLTSGSGTATASTTIEVIENQIYTIPFTLFAGVDMTDVDQITFMMEQDSAINDAIDFGVGFFGTDSSQTVATEESSFGSLKALYR